MKIFLTVLVIWLIFGAITLHICKSNYKNRSEKSVYDEPPSVILSLLLGPIGLLLHTICGGLKYYLSRLNVKKK
jgi:hypothetical protein